jgi:hypothetical protein
MSGLSYCRQVNSWRGPRGIKVEAIVLDRRPRLRVTQTLHGRTYVVGDYTRPDELARDVHLDLADLCEVIDLPVRRA